MRKKLKKRNAGFTMVELVVVMVVIGILAVISVPMYQNYIRRARAQEGVALMGSIGSAARVVYAEFGSFANADKGRIGVDTTNNEFFTDYTIMTNDAIEFVAYTDGVAPADGLQVTLEVPADGSTAIRIYDGTDQISGPTGGGGPY